MLCWHTFFQINFLPHVTWHLYFILLELGKAVHTDSYRSCVSFQLLQETLATASLKSLWKWTTLSDLSSTILYQKDNFELPLLSRISCNKQHTYQHQYQYLQYIPMEKESHHHHSLEETKWLGFMWYTGSVPPRRNDRVPLRLACHNDSTPQEVWVHRKTHLNGAGTGTAGPSTHTIRYGPELDSHATAGGHGRRVLWEASKAVSFRKACSSAIFCVLFCLRPTVFLGTKKCKYLLNVFCILGVGRRKNNPNRKENEVAMEETNKGVSADYIYILVSQPTKILTGNSGKWKETNIEK